MGAVKSVKERMKKKNAADCICVWVCLVQLAHYILLFYTRRYIAEQTAACMFARAVSKLNHYK